VSLDLRTAYLKDLTLFGCTIPEPGLFRDLVAILEQGTCRPVVTATFPLAQIAAAQSLFLEKRHTGKIVLVP
jgi:NADPH:quinone reductase-like Zn-dependent oxidoreductase